MLHLEILLNGAMNLKVPSHLNRCYHYSLGNIEWCYESENTTQLIMDVTMPSKWPSHRSIWFKTFSLLTQNMFKTGIHIIRFKNQKVCYWIILKIFKFATTINWMIIFLYVRAVLQAANWLSESSHIMYLLYKGCISCYS